MKKYNYKDYEITKLNKELKKQYNCNYLITINHDIYDFANTLKESKQLIDNSILMIEENEQLQKLRGLE